MAPYPDGPTLASDPELAEQTQQAMRRGTETLVRELADQGVTGTYPFVTYSLYPVVFLITQSDAERDLLVAQGLPRDVVVRHMTQAGVRPDLAQASRVGAESQETVDRDWGGNWYQAMR
ncbi:hypothetical protein [Cellulomonas fimi]|uniref:Uncharacterized protein n=1 Tax=Cellulomonas fimi (strain ATCC 484 / DSM 20113 / JCM 1341 / CCUG 24087 / LMG 16345 / NBRC 15513 / NCIMB 8980 / NCTC 7547 / NRS-133) TaxID=590998 RepID=F4H173_CELFA|nr:hypothetical protein [Cellulomonas fimi]AEE47442.1 hypothetical protein Celf_3329 [Cellulomonas fimi ATCC 484]NNH05580.1 hypothetical protein [Cellulomonas fimi]VEH36234.1 Uncharacterised protein [Cellulomonas fimi]